MSTLHRGFSAAAYAGNPPASPEAPVQDRPCRSTPLMRKFEIAVLKPDLTVDFNQMVAPASPLFEEAASAFARGTLIETVRGPVAVEDLIPGDYIQTAMGPEPITWIGSTTYIPHSSDDTTLLTHLTRVTADAMSMGHPPMDLLLGPAARMVVRHAKLKTLLGQDAVLAHVNQYIDGDRFLAVTPAGTVQLYHVMVRRHTTLNVGGVEVETFHPGNAASQQLGAKTRELFMAMFPHLDGLGDFGETCCTRTTREVVENLLDT
ncbi:Hint domain-containing protein [Sagittula salina]|uniref:Hint domain-containing protein n=1 Tax=Sagittula salina TaxID=2820268 RepID=A0A940S0S9_9RHOB|nr:Hint domain-containing protein [Sagittula salina]MBP0482342.1 Hint domain-containing protein [Sagittula salina]